MSALFAAGSPLSSRVVFAQARVLSEPPEPSLLALTRGWSRASPLGDLREAKTGSDHLELRVWAGYDTSTTRAIVLRRAGGRWSAFVARVLRCEMQIPVAVGDTASRETMRGFVAEARRHCGKPVADVAAGTRIITADTVVVAPVALADSTIEAAWTNAAQAGALDLPARVKHTAASDGFTYVVELRRGTEYRASEIERVEPPETDADRRILRVYQSLSTLLERANAHSSPAATPER